MDEEACCRFREGYFRLTAPLMKAKDPLWSMSRVRWLSPSVPTSLM